MKLLVTGGAGFIGANLCRRMVEDGHEVRVIDNLTTGAQENVDGIDVELLTADIRDADALKRAAAGGDTIVHLAARGSVQRSVAEPLETHDVNVNGTLNVLTIAREVDAHVVFSSSSSVYGANLELPKRETMRTEPMSPYAASKLAGESYALAYQRVYEMPVLVFRFFNVYGPLQPAGHVYAAVVPTFVDALLRGRPLQIHGDGEQSRDFTSVSSVVEVLSRAVTGRTTSTRPVNLAFNTRTTLLELVALLEEITGATAKLEFVDARAGDVRASQADPASLLALFSGLAPQPLRAGLVDTVAWFESRPAP